MTTFKTNQKTPNFSFSHVGVCDIAAFSQEQIKAAKNLTRIDAQKIVIRLYKLAGYDFLKNREIVGYTACDIARFAQGAYKLRDSAFLPPLRVYEHFFFEFFMLELEARLPKNMRRPQFAQQSEVKPIYGAKPTNQRIVQERAERDRRAQNYARIQAAYPELTGPVYENAKYAAAYAHTYGKRKYWKNYLAQESLKFLAPSGKTFNRQVL